MQKYNKVELKQMRKILKMDKKNFIRDISSWSEEFGYTVEENNLIIPPERVTNFVELLMLNKPFKKEK